MACCRCDKTGTCKGCSCAKEGRNCDNCLPGHLNKCQNSTSGLMTGSKANTSSSCSTASHQLMSTIIPAATSETDSGTSPSIPIFTTAFPANGTISAATSATSTPTSVTPRTTSDTSTTTPGLLLPPDNHLSSSVSPVSSFFNPQTPIPAIPNATYPDLDFTWGTFSGSEMLTTINKAYDEIVHWRHNLFLIPTGSDGNSFVQELARLLQAFADGSSLECIRMKAVIILQVLVLQKPSRTSKTREHISHLKRRMALWKAGNLNEILLEERSIQKHLPKSGKYRDKVALAKSFQNLMSHGKVNKALRQLSPNLHGGVLGLDEPIPDPSQTNPPRTTHEILTEKHTLGKPASADSLLPGSPTPVNPILFEKLNAEAIRKAAIKTNGAAGLSGLDAYAWRRLCSSFKSSSNALCSALASVGKRLCTTHINPDHLSAFVACRLIPLDKCPGVRPIGIWEVHRRIIAKAILVMLKQDILEASGPLQVCAGQESSCEAAIHAMSQTFADEDIEGAHLVDATNAFNSINRQAALHNISIICPPLAQVLLNTCCIPVRCIIQGGGEI